MILRLFNSIILILLFNCIVCCKKQEPDYVKKNDIVLDKLISKKIENDTLPKDLLLKYESKKYFKSIIKKDKKLVKDINRVYLNKTVINYEEISLDKDLTLCKFIFYEEVQYDYYYRNEKLIFKSVTPLNKAHYKIEYKDWNGDNVAEIITDYEEWEGGAGLGYYKIKSIYDVKEDTIMRIVSYPIESSTCQFGNTSLIEEYKYKFDSKTNKLTINKTIGSGDCGKNDIKVTKSKTTKTILLDKYNNPFVVFD